MNNDVKSLLQSLDEFERTSESYSLDLRMSLSRIVLARLRELNWTQRRLAHETGFKESFVSRVLHGDENCTFATAGKLLHAVGIRAQIATAVDVRQAPVLLSFISGVTTEANHGEFKNGHQETKTKSNICFAATGNATTHPTIVGDRPLKAAL